MLDLFGARPGMTVLELGPGNGYFSIEAGRLLGAGGRLVCLDIQRPMLTDLRGRLAAAGVANATPSSRCASPAPGRRLGGRGLPGDGAREIPDRPQGLAELRRVLRPGGTLSITEHLTDPTTSSRAPCATSAAPPASSLGSTNGASWASPRTSRCPTPLARCGQVLTQWPSRAIISSETDMPQTDADTLSLTPREPASPKPPPTGDLAALLRVLGTTPRLRIFALLTRAELCVCEIEDILGLSQSLVSNHLAVLRRAGLVKARRDDEDNRWIFYHADPETAATLQQKCLALLDVRPAAGDRRRAVEVCRLRGR